MASVFGDIVPMAISKDSPWIPPYRGDALQRQYREVLLWLLMRTVRF